MFDSTLASVFHLRCGYFFSNLGLSIDALRNGGLATTLSLDQELRDWYAAKDVAHGWSRPVLAHRITTKLHERETAALTNFTEALPNEEAIRRAFIDELALKRVDAPERREE